MSMRKLSLCTAMSFSLLALALASGCATGFKEDHYFQSISPKTHEVTNYYRLRVRGRAAGSSARYVSGYYDERAVDLFFNEVKVGTTSPSDTGVREIFSANLKDPGTQDTIKPLTPDQTHGAFVMILSTNASSVSRAIGQFAENQVVADAVTNLTNRDVLLRNASALTGRAARANATADELTKLVALLPDSDAPPRAETERALLRVLNSLATGIAGVPTAFDSLDQAATWFAQQSAQ
jgi:hypothetical protein